MIITNHYINFKSQNTHTIQSQPKTGHPKEAEFLSNKQKTKILTGSTVGMVAGLAVCARRQGLNIFKWHDFEKLKIESLEILGLATGSLVGGLASGIAVDKTNKKDKIKETLQQFVGNIVFPVGFVAAGNALYDYATKKYKISPPKLENKILNAIVKSLPVVTVTAVSLVAGIFAGNKIANEVNNEIFDEEKDRKIKITDLAAHVDDTLLGATLVAQNLAPAKSTTIASISNSASGAGTIGAMASRLIPPALVVPGYMAGTAQ